MALKWNGTKCSTNDLVCRPIASQSNRFKEVAKSLSSTYGYFFKIDVQISLEAYYPIWLNVRKTFLYSLNVQHLMSIIRVPYNWWILQLDLNQCNVHRFNSLQIVEIVTKPKVLKAAEQMIVIWSGNVSRPSNNTPKSCRLPFLVINSDAAAYWWMIGFKHLAYEIREHIPTFKH